MKELWYWKVNRIICNIVRKLTNHYFGCCENIFKNCDKCKYVIEERSGSGE